MSSFLKLVGQFQASKRPREEMRRRKRIPLKQNKLSSVSDAKYLKFFKSRILNGKTD
jgi:hypothetical protein